MKLVIVGNESKVSRLHKELALRLKRDGLDSYTESKDVRDIEVDLTVKLTAVEAVELIKTITDENDLEQFKSDTRKTVIDAVAHQIEFIQNKE